MYMYIRICIHLSSSKLTTVVHWQAQGGEGRWADTSQNGSYLKIRIYMEVLLAWSLVPSICLVL